MRKVFIIFFYFFIPASVFAQSLFRTIVPRQPLASGQSFQVQYSIQGTDKVENFKPPPFTSFRFVSGPHQYNGSMATARGIKPNRNIIYTLEAISPGRFRIPGANATVDGKPIKSNDVYIDVISKEKAARSVDRINRDMNPDYVLRPGEDPYEKIRQNMFLKLVVDRTTCFAGEPVQAIFKLFSRLESNSDIVKNPGFYGFTVHDMVNLSDKQINSEMVNGKMFDVHTIRKVQLYPLQEGTFTIDPMEINNKVEFSRSLVNKKTEQEIVEGISGNNNEVDEKENTEVFETGMRTEPVFIHVKPVPVMNKPVAFNGAVGDFAISASVVKEQIAKNEESVFEIKISGNGNFTQLATPVIEWPLGIEGFEPVVSDSLDKTKLPLMGSRIFRYSFIGNNPGLYQLPSVPFSFFDPRNNSYKTISTVPAQVNISNEEKKNSLNEERKESISDKNARASRLAGGIVILLVIIVLSYWIFHKSKAPAVVQQEMNERPTAHVEFVFPDHYTDLPDKEFYTLLHQSAWKYLGNRLHLEGSSVNKETLFNKLQQDGVDDKVVAGLQKILSDCEIGMYTGAEPETNKEKMLAGINEILAAVNRSLF